jgi:hypothetical protein
MKNKDTIALSEAYTLIQEKNFKSAVAAAAMGLSSLHGQGLTADDLADRANPHEKGDTLVPKQYEAPKDEETNYHKALVAFQKALKLKVVDNLTLSQIALDKDIAKRYALFLVQHGQRIPDIIRKATSKYASDLESAFSSDIKN